MRVNSANNANTSLEPRPTGGHGAFCLLEVLTALAILAFVATSVLVVVDRCIGSASDSVLRMEAFQLARENMEKVLASESVMETVDNGRSERYPDIAWQTVIEPFSEPLTGKMWIRAVCSADYVDSTNEEQSIELEHWIAELTDQQANQLMGQQGNLENLVAEQQIETPEDAAVYADTDVETIKRWIEDGLVTMEGGGFVKYNLDIFIQANGEPSVQQRRQQVESVEELALKLKAEQGDEDTANVIQGADGKDPVTGLPYDQLEKMDVGEVMELMKRQKR